MPAPRRGLRSLVVLALAGHLAGALGVPLPRPLPAGGPSHPCDGRACGCSPEARAAGACCCFSAEQQQALAQGQRRCHSSKPAPASCCEDEQPAACCHGDDRPDCCTDHRAPRPAMRWLAGMAAQQCRATGPLGFVTLPPALPVVAVFSYPIDPPPARSAATLTPRPVCPLQQPPV